ncbi:hypothetical protein ACFP1I_29070 [Dyadobacter subterraneus]|uniref:NrtR DNA-binding winged helix domain-containing protein n=1 Tax=Dyadobacter subterraneus TaxID=2773304 RepID=A0ABR9WE62_9BACT|nr:hypothetical protein [Dyadobacter subterraneus]MBE9463419.1 hypothetical protein [Dyadobacter subterraneus]
MEKVLLKSVASKSAKKSQTVQIENDTAPVRLPVKLSAVIFSFFENELYVLLTKENPHLTEGAWTIPSRLLHYSEELDTTASGMLFELTNQKTSSTELLEVSVCNSTESDQIMSVSYFSCVRMEEKNAFKLKQSHVKWQKLARLAGLNFDGHNLINNARVHLQYNATLRPFCFDFLPEYFTIPQVQKVYETIFGVTFDRRNFSKKLLATGLLLDSGFKVDVVVTNKAKLYRLDKDKYTREFCQLSNFVHSNVRQLPFL